MSACTEPRTGIGAVCVEYGPSKWPITMLNHTDIPGTEKCFDFYFWHPMLVRPAMKRLFFPWKTKEKRLASLARLIINNYSFFSTIIILVDLFFLLYTRFIILVLS